MTQPEGFVRPKNSGKVFKLQRSIYGFEAGLLELESSF